MAETEIRTLGAAKMIDANWTSMVQKLRKDLLHHIEHEESEIFDAARKVLSDEESRQIGSAFERLKPEMSKDADSLVASTLDLVANLLPTRFSENFRDQMKKGRKKAA